MKKPKALASTQDDATAEIEEFAQQLIGNLGLGAGLVECYSCVPCLQRVQNAEGSLQWSEGMWGVVIQTASFSLSSYGELNDLHELIHIDDVSIAPSENKLKLTFALSACVADQCPNCQEEVELEDLSECENCGLGICSGCEETCIECRGLFCFKCSDHECDGCGGPLCNSCYSKMGDMCSSCQADLEEVGENW